MAWEEYGQSGFGNPQKLITRAVKTHRIKSTYWGRNGKADAGLRKELGLDGGSY